MKDLVSNRWIGVVGLVSALSVACAGLAYYGYPGTALGGALLALLVGFFLRTRSSRSMTMNEVLRDVEAEPARPPMRREGAK